MRSPFADCDAVLYSEVRSVKYRNENYNYTFVCYRCPVTNELFTTDEQDEVNMAQVLNQYRDAHNIPYADEIRNVRRAYGVSALKMSQILSWGDNQYRLYENGEMPNANNGKQLRAIQNPSVFCNYVDMSSLTEEEKRNIKERAISSVYNPNNYRNFVKQAIFGNKQNGKYIGYTYQSLSKLKNVMLYFIGKYKRVFQTQMNKLLFYVDFLSYREFGHGITGLSYFANNFGPVPTNWDKVFCLTDDVVKEVIICDNGNEGYILTSTMPFDEQDFSSEELSILDKVCTKFDSMSPRQISEESHKEKAWIDNVHNHNLIDYSYAFSMITI